MGNAIVKLVKKVKTLEGILKRRNVVLSDSEEEESEAQGRKSQDDPLDSLVQGLVESFAPMNLEATKASLKRFSEELQTKTTKRLKDDEAKDAEPTKNEQDDSVTEMILLVIRIVMNRYGMDGPEDELEKVFWKYLKNMFEEPLSTDPIWSALGQQRIISWRYYDSCRVHCLNLESMDIYMLIERTYPLSAEMCKAMLDKKLQGGKPR
ncbi:hypothetical protein Tco_0700945 [Tanacetum coccineum]